MTESIKDLLAITAVGVLAVLAYEMSIWIGGMVIS